MTGATASAQADVAACEAALAKVDDYFGTFGTPGAEDWRARLASDDTRLDAVMRGYAFSIVRYANDLKHDIPTNWPVDIFAAETALVDCYVTDPSTVIDIGGNQVTFLEEFAPQFRAEALRAVEAGDADSWVWACLEKGC